MILEEKPAFSFQKSIPIAPALSPPPHQIPIIYSHLNGLKLSSNRKVVINTASAPDGLGRE